MGFPSKDCSIGLGSALLIGVKSINATRIISILTKSLFLASLYDYSIQ